MINPGFNISINEKALNFIYGTGVFGPIVENRALDSIRKSLKDPNADGPDVVYSIAMDVGKSEDKEDLVKKNLLFGAVIYSKGKIGEEPVRSQGHIHSISTSCGMSTPEVYEIWQGKAIIYMQETAKDNPGRCFAVEAKEGDVVIVPPYWAHYTVNADPKENLVFGAWCVRDYGFDYDEVRSHNGLAFFPILDYNDKINWIKNKSYKDQELIIKKARKYEEFNLNDEPIYTQYENDREKFLFVANPMLKLKNWGNFIP
ncbi:MAG: glucose-6-phosphate isomerase [Sebaldella sp.]|nr:glucose-6-phosphate isomerase [Sebaldella sp.]